MWSPLLDNDEMVEVSKTEFYSIIGPMDVHPHPEGTYPYLDRWMLRDGRTEVGRSQDTATYPTQSRYVIRTHLRKETPCRSVNPN